MLRFVDKVIALINLRLRITIQPDPVISIQYELKGSFSTAVPVFSHLAFAELLVLWIITLVPTSRVGCSQVTYESYFSHLLVLLMNIRLLPSVY